ncbi:CONSTITUTIVE EXPRESSER OF PR GENES 1, CONSTITUTIVE EXPRESSER OF PR GENES 30 [Hibiscus trionum]|uniref:CONSTITUTIVE EXPRESSER OF PR GENES 1, CONSTITUTIVE EXPRESSER OF PR GENES 30 n=1 Tax=Hibiscus trionum TaxID=183268 RepID=A0A9W7LW92_HIBTR|nr:CONSTITUTIVE EXPRESSER OF PR GENES 1, CONSTITUTIVE EXPRESSER OF PR GENES 30 [Hibiscus trionum]
MSDYMPLEAILKILNRLPVKSLLRFRSVCKSWNSLISHPSFISSHLQASLSNNTPFLLLGCLKRDGLKYSLHYDNDGFGKLKQLQFPPRACVFGSCNGLICIQLYPYNDGLKFLLWNPSIQKYISLPQLSFSEAKGLNVGFGFDSRTNDYKLLIIGADEDHSWLQPYLFSLNGNCWKRVTTISTNYDFLFEMSMPFVNGAVHWLGYQKRNYGQYRHAILGFDLSTEEFFKINLPESLTGLLPVDLSIMKYGESSIAVSVEMLPVKLHELWVMKDYGVVESWTKLLSLQRIDRYAWIPRVLGFRKNGEVLLRVHKVEMASLDLNFLQFGASLCLNCRQVELHGVEVGTGLLSVYNYVESLVLLDKEVDVRCESDVNHLIYSSDSDESSGVA